MGKHRGLLLLLSFAGLQICIAQQEAKTDRDTIYYLSPVIVNPTQALERETPATFTNLEEKQIAERYSVQDVPLLLSDLPSITFYSENGNGIGYNYINMRGFDQRRVSVMINGVPQNDPEDHNVYWIDFPDLLASTDMIQVQRGAGNNFYGPPAIGGSVNLVTNPFNRTPGVEVETMFGFQQFSDSSLSLPLTTRKYSVAVNSGLINQRYMIYGKLGKIMSDGYRKDSWVNLNSYFIGAVRLDHNMVTRVHFFGGPFTDGLSYYGLPKFVNSNPVLRRQNPSENLWEVDSSGTGYSYFASRRSGESESFSQPHYELMNEWRPSSTLSVSNTIFYYSGDGYYDFDGSWADTSMFRIGYNYGIPTSTNPTNTLIRAFVGNRQWGWLPRVEINHMNGTATIGAELRFHRSTHWGKIAFADDLPSSLDPDYHFYEYNGEKDILSFYANELYHPAKDWTLMGDLQIVRDRYGILNEKYIGTTFSVPYFFINPRAGINLNINNEWNAYFSLAFTSREPRLKNLYSAEESYYGATPLFAADTTDGKITYHFDQPLVHPERLLDFELGTHYRQAGAQFSADVFWMEFTDELVESGQVDIFGEPITGNADRTRHIGLEVDGSMPIIGNLTLSGNFTISHNRLVHFRVINDGTWVTLDGNPIAGFPDLLGNLRLTYHNDVLTSSMNLKYVGPFYTDNFKNDENKNNDYTVVNAEIFYRLPQMIGSNFLLRGEVNNLFNRLYFLNGEGNQFFPAAERNYLVGITADF